MTVLVYRRQHRRHHRTTLLTTWQPPTLHLPPKVPARQCAAFTPDFLCGNKKAKPDTQRAAPVLVYLCTIRRSPPPHGTARPSETPNTPSSCVLDNTKLWWEHHTLQREETESWHYSIFEQNLYLYCWVYVLNTQTILCQWTLTIIQVIMTSVRGQRLLLISQYFWFKLC